MCHPGLPFGLSTPAVESFNRKVREHGGNLAKLAPSPCFIHFDSLRCHNTSAIVGTLREYVPGRCSSCAVIPAR